MVTGVSPAGIAFDHVATSGIPVVLIHAGIADRRMWNPQWAQLSSAGPALRLDLRGYGDSTIEPDGAWSHVADVLETLRHVGIDRCHLVGASFGAGVAVEVALTAPELVESMLLCPPGGSLLAELTPDLKAFFDAERDALARDDLDAAVEANIDAWVVGPRRSPNDPGPELIAAVRIMQRRAFDVAASWRSDAPETELDPPALDRLTEIAARTLVITGGHDLDTTHDAASRVVAGIPGARRIDWPDVAHLPSLENPEAFLDILLDWTAPDPGVPAVDRTAFSS
ncbi:pimeloyl-ACP methyl ester carboxylesterase [Agromyces flavus]|uniref:Pimeloyl-ACP methyl ester carboxylesterase n=1 Tax=Agromyces flavus TaxID=589382 RepID=A0A1H1WSL2_9MICO|nr:alpha/beta hydrolase [Agromyces flavus]MCP2366242.1 pimeloyl-ACP methyl ester carboxylesterase [Agromyces flavus]GGI44282.1 alpha/beta hydrolase [Agromyces flavus]SDT00025.1 Pimeloyl-ACP methyl ester carboxylesterase [Agromyces flavus]